MIHPLAQEPPPCSSSQLSSPPKFDASSCAMTPADFAKDTETQVFYAPHSPELPHPRHSHEPQQQRAYSVTAMPSELQRTVLRHQQHLAEQQQRQQILAPDLPWWQHYYQLYHYHPPPGRKPTIFGPYLLLQTLGEGEFGKVKLGIHIETGHEVAIKLIKKDNIDSSSRMSKVEREISVLRQVRHPYIVKLYDVIETERYIGIILQCASGGELFEYILAHRYLREKDASRLFAQLISGVHYMHQKHIVHRDLKLENLLLDKNLCVIITDFGFANQFTSAKDDLMSTSCGSPCYAAPELVISEGLYVGSAVDIWSCGVILYAMLCGYLPFDDDPANPDGDNINLLYKYILNTPLAFPDYVSAEARDLLSKMLVPDPAKRCTMEDIMSHPWLSAHRALFEKSLEDLEQDAMSLAELPLSVTEPPLSPTPNHTRRNTVPAGFDISNETRLHAENDAVVPTAITEQEEKIAAVHEQAMPDQTVPKEDEEEQQQQMNAEEPEQQKEEKQQQQPQEQEEQRQKEKEEEKQKETEAEMQDDDSDDKMQVDTPAEKQVEDDKQEQKDPAFETEPHDVSSIDLGASTHTDSDSTKENIIDEAVRPQSPRKRNTDRILSFLTPSTSSSKRSSRPFSMSSGDHQQHSTLANSILHAKFLSSTQRMDNSKLNDLAAALGPRPPASSVSTPYQHQKPLPPRPSVTQHQPSPPPTVGASHPVRGTRRKALSLLVNPLSDTEKARRSTSVRPTIKTPRMTPPKEEEEEPKPSASDHSNARLPPSPTSPNIKHKSAGKKLMDWFKKKPMSTKHNENLYPGRPLAAYGMDFNDAKLRVHHGAVDQHALTSRSPQQVFSEVKQTLLSMGIDVKDDGEYKLKGIRRKRKSVQDNIKKRRTTNPRLVMLLRGGNNNQSSDRVAVVEEDTLYGDPSQDPGEEVRFSVELCKIKNLPGLYIVDIRRMRGNVWSYKFIYHAILNALDLSGKGGYMSTRSPAKDRPMQQPVSESNNNDSSNRISVASSSNASVDEKTS